MGKRPKYKQGKFSPKFPEKYKGDPNGIVYRSGLELKFFNHFDTRKNILEWASEEFYVPYTAPDGTRHRYYVDVWVKVKTRDGRVREFICEIKPSSQTVAPKKPKRMSEAYRRKWTTYLLNKCKWDAAEKFAMRNNMKFITLTERDI